MGFLINGRFSGIKWSDRFARPEQYRYLSLRAAVYFTCAKACSKSASR
jgi:hypothetical protein